MADDSTSPFSPTAVTAVQHSAPSLPLLARLPEVLGYTVTHEIARGGMGVVYAADDPVFDRQVAVKVMHAGLDAGRFVVEAKVTAQLPHPGIPPVYALGTLADGRPYLVMKLIQGRTLAEELRYTDPPCLPLSFEQICLTVGFAHARGIVHRDLKPANVMVGAFGEVLVMDWGLAKVAHHDRESGAGEDRGGAVPGGAAETLAGQVKGTPAFMAPEQARGEPVDCRADVFALGGILAVMLTGHPPFLGDTVLDTILKAALADLNVCFGRLATCGADAELVAVAQRCLAANPNDRFPNGEAVAEAVAAYRSGVEKRLNQAERNRAAAEARAREEINTRREAEARAEAERASATEQRKRRRVQLALATAVLLMVIGGGAAVRHQDQQTAERKLTEQRADAAREAEREAEYAERRLAEQRAAADRRAVEARLTGERDAETRNKVAQARQGVTAALALATSTGSRRRAWPLPKPQTWRGARRSGRPTWIGRRATWSSSSNWTASGTASGCTWPRRRGSTPVARRRSTAKRSRLARWTRWLWNPTLRSRKSLRPP